MPEAKEKKKTGLIVGIACGAAAVIAGIVILIIVLANGGNITGKYNIYSITEGDTTFELDKIKTFYGEEAASGYIELNSDGKGKMLTPSISEPADITYDKDKKTITADGEAVSYEINGDKITVKIDSTTSITYKKN